MFEFKKEVENLMHLHLVPEKENKRKAPRVEDWKSGKPEFFVKDKKEQSLHKDWMTFYFNIFDKKENSKNNWEAFGYKTEEKFKKEAEACRAKAKAKFKAEALAQDKTESEAEAEAESKAEAEAKDKPEPRDFPLEHIWKLPIAGYRFKKDLTKEERSKIQYLLNQIEARIKLLHNIMDMLWKSYLQFIGFEDKKKPKKDDSGLPENFDIVLQKGNADRLFQKDSGIRSMTFYLSKMLFQSKIDEIIEISKKYRNMQITDITAFDVFSNAPKEMADPMDTKYTTPGERLSRLMDSTCDKIKQLSYIGNSGKSITVMDLIDILSDMDSVHKNLYKEQTGKIRDFGDVYGLVFYLIFKVHNPYVMIILSQITMAYPTEYNETANLCKNSFDVETMWEIIEIMDWSKQKNKNYRLLKHTDNPYMKDLYKEDPKTEGLETVEPPMIPNPKQETVALPMIPNPEEVVQLKLARNDSNGEAERNTLEFEFRGTPDVKTDFLSSEIGMMKVVVEDGPEENKDSTPMNLTESQTTQVDEITGEKARNSELPQNEL